MICSVYADPYKIDEKLMLLNEEQLQRVEDCVKTLREHELFPAKDSDEFTIGHIVEYVEYIEQSIALCRARLKRKAE